MAVGPHEEATVRSHQPGLATVHANGGEALAVWAGGFVLPLTEAARRCGVTAAPPASIRQALPDWDRWCGVVREMTADGGPGEGGPADSGWQDETEVTFLPSVTDPPTVYCAAANYHDHANEMRAGQDGPDARDPMFFVGTAASLGGHRQDVVRPAGCKRLDWEVELAVVIGQEAKDVAAADAGSVIAGYSVANDISLRDFARREDYPFFPDWLRSKSYAGCLPLGPAVVPAAFVPDPMNLALSLTVNGEQRQASSTKNMIFSVAEQIEYLSHIAPLRAGDVILTGTPAGTGRAWAKYLSPGDVMVAEVQGLGRLETRVQAEKGE
jgi:2-keto-4-pentenoate hydratase/2-oxohepta-3-ene-1,7-dioic acid hydratase in catechol pathway